MTSKPLVLITPCTERKGAEFADTSLSLSDRYPRAIVAAGGIPWVLPCLPSENMVAEADSRSRGLSEKTFSPGFTRIIYRRN